MQPPNNDKTQGLREAPGFESPLMGSNSLGRKQLWRLGGFLLLLSLAFMAPLLEWAQLSLAKERNSYLIVVPFISFYLIWGKRHELTVDGRKSSFQAFACAALGLGAIIGSRSSYGLDPQNRLSWLIFSYLCFFLAGGFHFAGRSIVKSLAFPLAFLLFAVPMPPSFAEGIEIFLQYTSAEAASWMLFFAGIPVLRNGLEFQMPGIAIRVAQECSGYNSSFVLLMVSLLAGHMFLKSSWKKCFLTFAVIPLAIIRNGFRISTLSVLCVKLDPSWIDSPLHHRGGPVFFALSLIPFLVLLWTLRRVEAVNKPTPTLTRQTG